MVYEWANWSVCDGELRDDIEGGAPSIHDDEVLYEVDANPENWMVAGRKRGHVSLSMEQDSYLLD
ncbi:hypothetical protein AMTR_s00003p00258550 [Amborella trichopoda]|uniref:TRAPPC10/Trs130 C-terminal domain-containing protein n=1 Tax=Amborella trichopoda TaxID=13333 RepID=W1P665_AMBTC|nr:hypothetical protein AMTR_s00003p00258550 [Amborella trichopoda]